MTDEPGSIVLRYLPRMDAKIDNLAERVDDLASEVRGAKNHMAGFLQDHLRHDGNTASLRAGAERIEPRLDLQEGAS